MKNVFVIALLTGLSTSCSTIKNTNSNSASQATTASRPEKTTNTPVFLDNISIRADRKTVSETKPSSKNEVTPLKPESTVKSPAVELTFPLQFKYSILLNVPVEELGDEKTISFIEEWYGTKYRYGGNDKTGVDCSAFTKCFIDHLYSINIPRTSVDQYIHSKRVKKENLQQGDLVFFRTTKKSISHVGIYLQNNKFVHASTSYGVVISDLDEDYYARRFAGAGRVTKPFSDLSRQEGK